jgi:hypothetical protein
MQRKAVENALLRCRRLYRRAGAKVGKDRYEVFTLAADHYVLADTLQDARQKAKDIFQQTGKAVSVWSPYRAHVFHLETVDRALDESAGN